MDKLKDELVIRNSKKKCLKKTIIPSIVLITFTYFFITLSGEGSNIIFLRIAFLVFSLVFLTILITIIKKANSDESEIIFNNCGLYIKNGTFNNITIPWKTITGSNIYFGPKGPNLILIQVNNPEFYLSMVNPLKRLLVKLGMLTYKTPIIINPTFLELNEFEILGKVRRYTKKYKNKRCPTRVHIPLAGSRFSKLIRLE